METHCAKRQADFVQAVDRIWKGEDLAFDLLHAAGEMEWNASCHGV